MTEYAFPFKVMSDAVNLRQHVVQQMENYRGHQLDPARRRWYLSFVIVGTASVGIEVAGEVNELVRSSTQFLPGTSVRKMLP